jgi:putative ABC transport system permease protein
MSLAAVLIGLFVLTYGGLALIASRRPLLARMAFREVERRPWQSALVVAGLTIGTSMILMSLVNTDSIATSLTQATYQSWGRVDLLVSANGAFFSPDVARGIAGSPHLKGKVRGVQAGVELFGGAADLDRRLDNPTVRLIGFDPSTQAAFGAYTLVDGRITSGQDLAADEVLLSRSLADSFQAQLGDRIQVAANEFTPAIYRVAGIARPEGAGDYGGQPAIFATLAAMDALTGSDRINVIRISALGDGKQELDNSQAIAPQVTNALRGLASDVDLRVRTAKADDVNEIINLAAQNGPITLVLSFIVVLAGIALVVNLALALAEERRPQLAVLRALGLSRSGLVITSVLEGGIYSLCAAAIGVVPGIATAWLLVSKAGQWIPEIHEKNATVLFVVSAESIAIAIAIGALITLITLLIASIRTSRLAIASAVRALPDPPANRRPRKLQSVAIVASGVAGLAAAVFGNTDLRLLGGLALIAVVGLTLRGHVSNRVRSTLISIAAAIWVIGLYARPSAIELVSDPWTTILGIVCLVGALTALVAVNMRVVERFVPRVLVAQLTRRPVRLTLATAALGLVFSFLAFIAAFLASTNPDYARDTGGYNVSVSSMTASSITLSSGLQSKIAAEMAISTGMYFGPVRSSSSDRGPGPLTWHQQLLPVYGLTDSQLAQGTLPLIARDARFSSDAAVWAALRNDPNLVVSGVYQPGTAVDLIGNNGPEHRQVAASFRPGFLAGLVGSAQAVAPISSRVVGTTLLLRLKPGVDASSFALDVRRSTFPSGVEASSVRDLLDQGGALFRNFASETELMLSAGLAVGVLSLGVLALRAVVERRRWIGLLRAVGFQPRQLLGAVVGESVLTAAAGVAVGGASGLVFGYLFIASAYPGSGFGFQGGNFAVAAALVLVTAVAVTVAPALAVARTAPAEALRLID